MSVGTDLEIQLTKHQHHHGTWLFYTIHRTNLHTVTRRRRDSDNIRETFQRTQHACHRLCNTIVNSNKHTHHIQVHTWNCAAVQIFMDELCMSCRHTYIYIHTFIWMRECNRIHKSFASQERVRKRYRYKMEQEYSQGSVSTFCHSPAKDYTHDEKVNIPNTPDPSYWPWIYVFDYGIHLWATAHRIETTQNQRRRRRRTTTTYIQNGVQYRSYIHIGSSTAIAFRATVQCICDILSLYHILFGVCLAVCVNVCCLFVRCDIMHMC